MKEIPLTKGKVAIVDDEDFEELSRNKWHSDSQGYAARKSSNIFGKRKTILMHREIMCTPESMETDHINGDKLDNRRDNLRVCTTAENSQNKKRSITNTSGFKGVSWVEKDKKWRAYIRVKGRRKSLGYFDNLLDAACAYDNAACKIFGNFARPNFPK